MNQGYKQENFSGLHLQNAYLKNNSNKINLKNSEYLGRNGLYIPIGKHVNKNTKICCRENI